MAFGGRGGLFGGTHRGGERSAWTAKGLGERRRPGLFQSLFQVPGPGSVLASVGVRVSCQLPSEGTISPPYEPLHPQSLP